MIILGLGSNEGHRLSYLQRAVQILERDGLLHRLSPSMVIETAAILPDQAPVAWNRPYLNMIVCGESFLSPDALLRSVKKIESDLGRAQHYLPSSPRCIDIDILFYHDQHWHDDTLHIPHPQYAHRPFLIHLLYTHPLSAQIKASCGIPDHLWQAHEGSFSQSFALSPALMGIVNCTPDSFSDGGLYLESASALSHIEHLIHSGASVIDIGAQSTKPRAAHQGLTPVWEEQKRLFSVLEQAPPFLCDPSLPLSIDSFSPDLIRALLDFFPQRGPQLWINDVYGLFTQAFSSTTPGKKPAVPPLTKEEALLLEQIIGHGACYLLTHSLSVPPNSHQILDQSSDPMEAIMLWAESSIDFLAQQGLQRQRIIIDPGIGFGKTMGQNMHLLRELPRLQACVHAQGARLCVGHSRKSFLRALDPRRVALERDTESVAVSLAIAPYVDYLRVHSIVEHQKALVAYNAIQKA